uniref:BTB domain-containing protein n=1 Tax=Strigamia maritima TaxID=126957 RepID=T1IWK4_STRMM
MTSDDYEERRQRSIRIANKLYNSREEGQEGIITLQCKDGRVYAHECVLNSRTDYFWGIISRSNFENERNVATIPDTSMEVMNIVIRYLYEQDFPSQSEKSDVLMREILIAADKMQLKHLFDEYWSLYCTPITLENFLKVWQLAERFNQDGTIEEIRIFVLENIKEICDSDFMADITMKQLKNIVDCNGDGLGCDKLVDFVTFLLAWGTKCNKMEEVLNLISKFDFRKLPGDVVEKISSVSAISMHGLGLKNDA